MSRKTIAEWVDELQRVLETRMPSTHGIPLELSEQLKYLEGFASNQNAFAAVIAWSQELFDIGTWWKEPSIAENRKEILNTILEVLKQCSIHPKTVIRLQELSRNITDTIYMRTLGHR